jgi:hypothetical protein
MDAVTPFVEPDPWSRAYVEQQRVRVEGVIADVQRRSIEGLQTEQIFMIVEPSVGMRSDILLGPAWYVMSQDAAPLVGTDVSLETFAVSHLGRQAFIAEKMMSRGMSLILRDESGMPLWEAGLSGDAGYGEPVDEAAGANDLVVASHLVGIPVYAAGERFGTIDNVLVETNSGTAAFVEVESGGLFGVGADRCVIPLTAATLEEPQRMQVDLSPTELRESRRFIGQAAGRYDDMACRDRIYKFFGVPPVHFDVTRGERWRRAEAAVAAGSLRPVGALRAER